MKNTIITSVSALAFLVIGLFIGKSNKQIEIQTVVKTNIVEKIIEKPVVEYIDKYVTNVVEKVVQAGILSSAKIAAHFMNQCYNGESLISDSGVQLPFTESIAVDVFITENIKDIISASSIEEKLELEIRKAGIKIDKKSKYKVYASIDATETKDKLAYIFQTTLKFKSMLFLYDGTIEKSYYLFGPVWQTATYGSAGKEVYNQKYVYDQISELCDPLINRLLAAKERYSKPK